MEYLDQPFLIVSQGLKRFGGGGHIKLENIELIKINQIALVQTLCHLDNSNNLYWLQLSAPAPLMYELISAQDSEKQVLLFSCW
jgi:hypothetical protein